MDFIDEIKNLSARAEKLGEQLHTEEATKERGKNNFGVCWV
jgi:hypothetical protein